MDKTMTESMGGEVGKEVTRLKGIGKIECHGVCFGDTDTLDIRGYEHDGGIPDGSGKKWWVYVHCNNLVKRAGKKDTCGYDMAWRHVR